MSLAARMSLRTRLALALVGVALLAVGLATSLANRGLHPRVAESASARLDRFALHFADVAAAVYRDQGGWTAQARQTLTHLALLDELRFQLDGELDGPAVDAPVVVNGREVGVISVGPLDGTLLTPEEQSLQDSLDRLHIVAAVTSVAAALILALALAQTLSRPLRRIRDTASLIEEGALDARVPAGGGPEIEAVGHALNRLAETLEHEEEVRKASVADLAHELRTPVSALLSRIEAAQDGVIPSRGANLTVMHSEALRLARLLDDLSRLADAERPGLLLEKRVLDLSEVGRHEGDAFAPLFAMKGVSYASSFEPVLVRADPERIGQVLTNLLSNALRYTDGGGAVELRVRSDGERAVVEVQDSGIGIAPADLDHVFTRFWRGEKSRSRSTGGAGIGLAIVHELVRAHEGTIEVASTPGAGSTFRVFLPAVRRPESERDARSGSATIEA